MVWEITKDWEGHWDTWKSGQFTELQTKDMEELSNTNFKKLSKLSRELKVSLLCPSFGPCFKNQG